MDSEKGPSQPAGGLGWFNKPLKTNGKVEEPAGGLGWFNKPLKTNEKVEEPAGGLGWFNKPLRWSVIAQDTDSSEKATIASEEVKSIEQVSKPNATLKDNEEPSDKTVDVAGEAKEQPSTPAKSDISPTKKPEDVMSSAPKDHAKKTKDKSEMQGDMGTLFILDLMKQRKEKMMRKKKDDLINDLAMKKKQQMMEARMGKRVLTRPAHGGFVGVGAILAGSKNTSPMARRRTPKPRSLEDNVDIPPPEDCELLIMGIIRDKKEQAYHEAHQVMSEQAGVPSDDKWLAKFGD